MLTLKGKAAMYMLHEVSATWIDSATRTRYLADMDADYGKMAVDDAIYKQRNELEQVLREVIAKEGNVRD